MDLNETAAQMVQELKQNVGDTQGNLVGIQQILDLMANRESKSSASN